MTAEASPQVDPAAARQLARAVYAMENARAGMLDVYSRVMQGAGGPDLDGLAVEQAAQFVGAQGMLARILQQAGAMDDAVARLLQGDELQELLGKAGEQMSAELLRLLQAARIEGEVAGMSNAVTGRLVFPDGDEEAEAAGDLALQRRHAFLCGEGTLTVDEVARWAGELGVERSIDDRVAGGTELMVMRADRAAGIEVG